MTTNTPANFAVGSWAFSAAHGESVRILDVETVWLRLPDGVGDAQSSARDAQSRAGVAQ